MKICIKCKIEKPTEEFHTNKATKDKFNCYCKKCDNERRHQKYINDGDLGRHKHRLRIRKITEQEYNILFEKQNGLCAICNTLEIRKVNNKIVPLSIDHNHTTGQVRGLLCSKCNVGLGHFNEDVALLQKAIEYLNSFNNFGD